MPAALDRPSNHTVVTESDRGKLELDATALRRGASRLRLQKTPPNSWRCHGLAPLSFTSG